jgi:hypothetical protein
MFLACHLLNTSRTIVIICLLIASAYAILLADAPDEWRTHFEKSDYLETSRYDESIAYYKRLCSESDFAHIIQFGTSPQGRELYYIAVSEENRSAPVKPSQRRKPVILIINGIHPGEIAGKDASKLLLRDILITGERRHLLRNADLLVVPVFNVDGHERFGPYNRINQNGPRETGWRTTAQNYNLNRDWTKADAQEMRAMLRLMQEWTPDFIIDTHSTNGADYQYTATYIAELKGNLYTETAQWMNDELIPYMIDYMNARGYGTFPYVALRNWFGGLDSGINSEPALPRFSSGYAAVQNRPSLVVETHMLKPYRDRVFATKAMIEAVLEFTNEQPQALIDMNRTADWISVEKFHAGREFLALDFLLKDRYRTVEFKGVEARMRRSSLTGGELVEYTGKPMRQTIRLYDDAVAADSVLVARVYLIPQEWSDIAERMKLHGIRVERMVESAVLRVTRYRFTNVEYASQSFEGRQRVDVDYDTFREWLLIPAGTYVVSTDQRTIRLIAHLLEPKSPDSFLRWGFLNTIFERREYFELYSMEPIAQDMIRKNPALKGEFDKWLRKNPQVRDDPYRRLYFFYERSPYYDDRLNLYPIMRVE